MGIDIRKFLKRAKEAAQSCAAVMPAESNDALKLGTILGECASGGRGKLTRVIDPRLETLGLWIEQLIAESPGTEDKGRLPVSGERVGEPSVYGDERGFVGGSGGA